MSGPWRSKFHSKLLVRANYLMMELNECVRGKTRLEAESPYRASVVHQECELLVARHVAKMAANSQCGRENGDDVCGKFDMARLLKLNDAVVANSFPRRI